MVLGLVVVPPNAMKLSSLTLVGIDDRSIYMNRVYSLSMDFLSGSQATGIGGMFVVLGSVVDYPGRSSPFLFGIELCPENKECMKSG